MNLYKLIWTHPLHLSATRPQVYKCTDETIVECHILPNGRYWRQPKRSIFVFLDSISVNGIVRQII